MAHVNNSIRMMPRPIYVSAPVTRTTDAPSGTTTSSTGSSFKTILNRPSSSTTGTTTTPTQTGTTSGTSGTTSGGTSGTTTGTSGTTTTTTAPAGGIGTMSPWPPLNVTPPQTPSSVPMAPTAQSLFGDSPWLTNPGGTGPSGSYSYNPIYFATPQTAAVVAKMLGGTVVASNAATPYGGFTQSDPNQMVQLPNGTVVNAGLIADMYNHGYTQQMVNGLLDQAVHGG